MRKLGFVFALALIAALIVPSVNAQEGAVFRTAGGWDAPPNWHGNHYQSGCCGAAWWWIWEPLFHYVPGSDEIIFRLADSYEESEDGLTSTVTIREGSMWHDGTPATSQDVWDSFAFERSWNATVWNFLEDIELPDERTVVFHWKQPTPIARQLLAGVQIRAPHHIYGEWAQAFWDAGDDEEAKQAIWDEIAEFRPENPIGTGPFMIDTVTENVMILAKFPDHPMADQIAFDYVRIERWSSNEAVWNMLQAGEIDAAHPAMTPDIFEGIQAAQPGIEMATVSDLGAFAIYFNPEMFPLELRQALAHAINRSEMREVSYYYAIDSGPYATGLLPSNEEYWLGEDFMATLTPYDYDPDLAASMLEDLGWTKEDSQWMDADGNPVSYTIGAPAAYSDWVLACENLAQQLTNFGIPSECQPRDNSVYWGDQDAHNYQIDIGWMATMWGTGHPYTAYDRFFSENGSWARRLGLDQVHEFEGPDGEMVDTWELVTQLGQALTFEEQQEIVRQLAYVSNENVFALPFLEKALLITHNTATVTGWPPVDDPLWTMCGGGIERFYVTLMLYEGLAPAE